MKSDTTAKTSAQAARRALHELRRWFDEKPSTALSEEDAQLLDELTTLAEQVLPNRALERHSNASAESSRVYFNYALTGILETDQTGRILRSNPAASSITGQEIKALSQLDLPALAVTAAMPRLDRHLALLLEQGISQVEFSMQRRDGREIVVEMASIQVTDDLFVHVFDDVTEQRAARAAIEAARAAAESANRAKSEFLANVSHELRTPMNGILGLTRLTLLTELDAQQRENLELITRSGRNLLRIVNDLLDAAKLESGHMDYEFAPFSLAELLSDLGALRAQIPADKPLELAFHVSSDVPDCLLGDRLRLGQCLTNLLGNAIKFTPTGRVDLQIGTTEDNGSRKLIMCVADTGIGIAADILPRLFTAFNQGDSSTARQYGGTGLGLHISNALAQGMGGKLQATSQIGVGSRFTLTLPLCVAADETSGPDPQAWLDAPQEFRGRRLLVAEDNQVNQIVIERWLTRAGIQIQLAADGEQLLALLATLETPPDLVLMDVQMPVLDGLEATRQLRSRGFSRPIIGLSAGVSRSEQDTCLAAGMNDFLGKPLDSDELWGCLTRWLPPMDGASMNETVAESAATRFLNDHETLARARAVFHDSHGKDAARLLEQLTAGDNATAARLAHGLKGAAATIGSTDIASLAHDLENALTAAAPRDQLLTLIAQLGHLLQAKTESEKTKQGGHSRS